LEGIREAGGDIGQAEVQPQGRGNREHAFHQEDGGQLTSDHDPMLLIKFNCTHLSTIQSRKVVLLFG